MRAGFKVASFFAIVAMSAAGIAAAQMPPPPPSPPPPATTQWFSSGQAGSFGAGISGGMGLPVTGMTGVPYSAEQVTEQVQTLADGIRITQAPQKTLFYRDSQGRTRTEHIFSPPPGGVAVSGMRSIQIMDPVAGYHYMLDSNNNTATRMAWPPQRTQRAQQPNAQGIPAVTFSPSPLVSSAPSAAAAYARPQADSSSESLGTQTIEGVIAEGHRFTTKYPEGFFGNDRPITTVHETWISRELGMTVLTKMSDPRSGETTTRLTNISRDEPDPALFQIPADYTIKDNNQ